MTNTLPKIYFTLAPVDGTSRVIVSAIAEDGTGLARTVADAHVYARYEIGVIGHNFHPIYHRHYPEGWMIVDHIDSEDDELEADVGYMRALYLNSFKEEDQDGDPLDAEAGEQGETSEDAEEGRQGSSR